MLYVDENGNLQDNKLQWVIPACIDYMDETNAPQTPEGAMKQFREAADWLHQDQKRFHNLPLKQQDTALRENVYPDIKFAKKKIPRFL